MANIIGYLASRIEDDPETRYVTCCGVGVNAMTKAQIVQITSELARLVGSNTVGIAPRSEKHVRRLAELKQKARARESQQQNNREPVPYAASGRG